MKLDPVAKHKGACEKSESYMAKIAGAVFCDIRTVPCFSYRSHIQSAKRDIPETTRKALVWHEVGLWACVTVMKEYISNKLLAKTLSSYRPLMCDRLEIWIGMIIELHKACIKARHIIRWSVKEAIGWEGVDGEPWETPYGRTDSKEF